MDGGAWIALAAQAPGWHAKDFSIQWYGRAFAGPSTPIQEAAYVFAEGPEDLDSDGDGVPDYVEIGFGLDPIGSAEDADGDGASDLLELLSGSDPLDPGSFPTRAGGPAGSTNEFDGNYANTFSFRLTPHAMSGASRYATLGAENASLGLFDLSGLGLGFAHTAGAPPQSALFEKIEAAYGGSRLVAATPANFDLTAPAPNKRRGREMVALVPVPRSDLGPVPHAYAGGTPLAAAQAWVLAARNHYSQARPEISQTLDASTTLRLLLVERKLEAILRGRGLLGPSQTLTLTSFRATESALPLADAAFAPADARFRLDAAGLEALRQALPGQSEGWDIATLDTAYAQALATPPDAATELLVLLAREIHFLSAAADDATLPQFPPPVDTLRRFLLGGPLPGDLDGDGVKDVGETSSYWGAINLSPIQVLQARTAVPSLLGLPASRPFAASVFVVDAQTFAGPVPVVIDRLTLEPHVLLQANGEPWPLAQFAPLVAGAELTVRGFTDVSSPHAPAAWEVIELSLTRLPASLGNDANHNLIGDAYEDLFPGLAAAGPFTDSDGDGFSDVEEYLNGTDPMDELSFPAGPPLLSEPPLLEITELTPGGQFVLAFLFPAVHAGKISFHLQQSPSLDAAFTDVGPIAPHLGGGLHEIMLAPGDPGGFWRFRLSLNAAP